MKIYEALKEGTQKLLKITGSQKNAQKECEELLEHLLSITRARLYMNFHDEIPAAELKKFNALLSKRMKHYPLQYLTGRTFFYGREFLVTEGVLIPRQDTEALVEAALKHCPPDTDTAAEAGCGTGIVSLTLLAELSQLKTVSCFDINPKAVSCTRSNASLHSMKNRINIVTADFFAYHKKKEIKYSLVVSNPPYIKTKELSKLQPEVQKEPHSALDGGTDGLDFYRAFNENAPYFMQKGGVLAVETGDGQMKEVKKIFSKAWKVIGTYKDFREQERAAVFKYK